MNRLFLIKAVSLLSTCYLSIAAPASAQVTFAWGELSSDFSHITNSEECLDRVTLLPPMVYREEGQYDTLTWKLRGWINSQPKEVVEFAKQCSERLSIDYLLTGDTLSVRSMLNGYALMLMAERDEDAIELVGRWMSSLSGDRDTLALQIQADLVRKSLEAKPARFKYAWKFWEQIDSEKWPLEKVTLASRISGDGQGLKDTQNAIKAAEWLVGSGLAMVLSLPDSVIESDVYQDEQRGIGAIIRNSLFYLRSLNLMDSLRVSTDGYARYRQALSDSSRMIYPLKRRSITPLQGEHWFPVNPTDPVPQKGKVSVIYTTSDTECTDCLTDVAIMRRLKEEFPQVEFVLLTNTKGYFGLVIEPPAPKREAELIDSVYRQYHNLPATVVVAETPFWHLPEPDRRRINSQPLNHEQFPEESWFRFTVVDRDGELVTSFVSQRGRYERRGIFEDELRQHIEAVLQQKGR